MPRFFYPKVGTSILKVRKFPLNRKPTYVLGHRPGVVFARRSPLFITRKDEYKFLLEYWAQGLTPKEVTDSRPQGTEYLGATNWREYHSTRGRYCHTPWLRGCESDHVARNTRLPVEATGQVTSTTKGLFEDSTCSSSSSEEESSDDELPLIYLKKRARTK